MQQNNMIKPLPGYVLIEPIEDETKTGEIYLPETSKDKPSKGKVVEDGGWTKEWKESWEDFQDAPGHVFLHGHIVIYKKWTNQEVGYEGKKYLLVKFDELLGIIE